MGKRTDVGATWDAIVATWCGGQPLGVPEERAWPALGTLERLWPAYLDEILAAKDNGVGGVGPIVNAMIRGEVLGACEGLVGFKDVLKKLRGKKESDARSFLAEALVGEALVRLGYVPEFYPPINDNILDLRVIVEGAPVYIEVIAPEQSNDDSRREAAVHALSETLLRESPGALLHLELDRLEGRELDLFERAAAQTIGDFLRETPPSDATHTLPGIGSVQSRPIGDAPTLQTPGGTVVSAPVGAQTLALIGFSSTDERVQEKVEKEAHHFSEKERNLVVVDVSAVRGFDLTDWGALVEGGFQEELYQKIGGVALMRPGAYHGDPSPRFQRWTVVRNRFAYLPLPDTLLNALAGLDDQRW